MTAISSAAAQTAQTGDRDLVSTFESLGDSCELGLVQRWAGAEPLGLLRFSSTTMPTLIRALNENFGGSDASPSIQIVITDGEFMVMLAPYGFVYHTFVMEGRGSAGEVLTQQAKTVPFLIRKLLGDLASGEKILVYRQRDPMLANDLADLRQALDRHGQATLLWVQEARPGHDAGTVQRIGPRLLTGYIRWMGSPGGPPVFDYRQWFNVMRRAHALWRDAADPWDGGPDRRAAGLELTFGVDGDAGRATETGWSAPEEGKTWAIGPSSVLIVPVLSAAKSFWLEIEAYPFTADPELPSQRLEVLIDGVSVHVFDPMPRGVMACVVPGTAIGGGRMTEIRLNHVRATSPAAIGRGADPRFLAAEYWRLSLSPAGTIPLGRDPHTIQFRAGGDSLRWRREGWSTPEDLGTWAVGDRSVLELPPLADGAGHRLELSMFPFTFPPVLEAQPLRVLVNDEPVYETDQVTDGTIECVVPAAVLARQDRTTLVLEHPRAARPADLGAGEDTRQLSIYVRHIGLTPVP